jgi:hypothetical protein
MRLIKYHFMSVIWPESPKGCLLLGESPLISLLFWIKNHAWGCIAKEFVKIFVASIVWNSAEFNRTGHKSFIASIV